MADNTATLAGNILFRIQSHTGNTIDMDTGIVEFNYYESVLSNTVSASATVIETGNNTTKEGKDIGGAINGLPIRGGESVEIRIEDAQATKTSLSFSGDKKFYVNRLRNIDPGVEKDLYTIDLSPREFFANEQVRVTQKFTGQPSDSVAQIMRGLIGTSVEVDKTARDYNFIGNTKKPFYIATWLASKSIPELSVDGKVSIGGAAGYFFFQNFDGFKFKSLDKLLDEERGVKGRYIFTGNPEKPEGYNATILSVKQERDFDLQQNLAVGAYANTSLFFDYVSMKYVRRDYNISENMKDKIKNAGSQEITWVNEEFTKSPSRVMTHILDVGVLPAGGTPDEQLKFWKENNDRPTYGAPDAMVQSIMRYNQLFTIKMNVVIAGDFRLRAGDLIFCDFAALDTRKDKKVDDQISGIYMIASVCHRITPQDTYTSLSLVRDTFGRKVKQQ